MVGTFCSVVSPLLRESKLAPNNISNAVSHHRPGGTLLDAALKKVERFFIWV
jgi:hypothetical protein